MQKLKILEVLWLADEAGLLDEPTERRYWVHPLIRNRENSGKFLTLYNDLRKYPEKFFDYYRMSINSFDELLKIVREPLSKSYTQFRNPIIPEERLTVTLRLSLFKLFNNLIFKFSM